MIEHSSSFREKTRFSQEKYIRKKEKKYVCQSVCLVACLHHGYSKSYEALKVVCDGPRMRQELYYCKARNVSLHYTYVTVLDKTDHSAQIHFLQYRPKALLRSQSRDFVISMPRYSTAS